MFHSCRRFSLKKKKLLGWLLACFCLYYPHERILISLTLCLMPLIDSLRCHQISYSASSLFSSLLLLARKHFFFCDLVFHSLSLRGAKKKDFFFNNSATLLFTTCHAIIQTLLGKNAKEWESGATISRAAVFMWTKKKQPIQRKLLLFIWIFFLHSLIWCWVINIVYFLFVCFLSFTVTFDTVLSQSQSSHIRTSSLFRARASDFNKMMFADGI
jgi:hypothetical protein